MREVKLRSGGRVDKEVFFSGTLVFLIDAFCAMGLEGSGVG